MSAIAEGWGDLAGVVADLEAVLEHSARAYPEEACGLGLGHGGRVARWVPIRNVAPTPTRRFELDPRGLIEALQAADDRAATVTVVYHSHCDAPARLSRADRAGFVPQGVELYPAALYVVVSVRQGRPAEVGIYRYDGASDTFEGAVALMGEQGLGVPSSVCRG